MPSCSVPGCNSSWKNSSDLKFYKFPRDTLLRLRWIECIGVVASKITDWCTVCGIHFNDTDFERDLRSELTGMYLIDYTRRFRTLIINSLACLVGLMGLIPIHV